MNLLITNLLKGISIRGRMVFCILTLEELFKAINLLEDNNSIKLRNKLKEFTSSNRLDLWEQEINEYDPLSILDIHIDNNYEEYSYLSKEELLKFRDFYLNLPKYILELISNTIEVGAGNIYGATGKYSSFTLSPTIKVISYLNNEKKILKTAKMISRKSPFIQNNGWGNLFIYDDFIVDLQLPRWA